MWQKELKLLGLFNSIPVNVLTDKGEGVRWLMRDSCKIFRFPQSEVFYPTLVVSDVISEFKYQDSLLPWVIPTGARAVAELSYTIVLSVHSKILYFVARGKDYICYQPNMFTFEG